MTLCTVQNRCSRVHCDLKVQRSYAKNYENFTNYSLKTIAKTIGAVKSKPKALRHFISRPCLKIDETFLNRLNVCGSQWQKPNKTFTLKITIFKCQLMRDYLTSLFTER